MWKKNYLFLLCCITACLGISAQESGRFSAGLELSTTGFGIEVATPLSSRFALRGGISFLPYSHNATFKTSIDDGFKNKIDNAIAFDPEIAAVLSQKGLPTRANDINTNIDATAKLDFSNVKILADFYPTETGAFHITAGVYIGRNKLINVTGKMDQALEVLNVLKDNGYDLFSENIVIDNTAGYQLSANDLKNVRGALTINSAKPYLGIGFGRVVPKSRVGVKVDLGAYYQGTPEITSDNLNIQKLINDKVADLSDLLKNFPIYPVLSIKINFRIF